MTLVETYANAHTSPPGHQTFRYTVHPEVMVGGELNDREDLEHLMEDHRVSAVLNVGGRSEAAYFRGMHERLAEVPLVDDGGAFEPEAVRRVLSHAMVMRREGRVLYVHCHIGVSRSPAIAYGVLRWVYGMGRAEALWALDSSGGAFGGSYLGYAPKHAVYIESVERALDRN